MRTAIQAARDDATPGEFGRTQSGSREGFIAVNLAWLARCLAERGEFEEGIAGGQEGLAIAEGLDHPYALAAAALGLGYLYAVKGDAGQAVPLLERSHLVTRDASLTLLEPQVQRTLGYVYALSGRVGEGVARLEQAVRAVEAKGLSMQHATAVAMRGEAYLRADRLDEARAAAERALALARERGQRGDEAFALRLLGAVSARTAPADPDATETHYRQALALADELGMRPLVARCHLGLGASFRRFGRRRRGPRARHHRAGHVPGDGSRLLDRAGGGGDAAARVTAARARQRAARATPPRGHARRGADDHQGERARQGNAEGLEGLASRPCGSAPGGAGWSPAPWSGSAPTRP